MKPDLKYILNRLKSTYEQNYSREPGDEIFRFMVREYGLSSSDIVELEALNQKDEIILDGASRRSYAKHLLSFKPAFENIYHLSLLSDWPKDSTAQWSIAKTEYDIPITQYFEYFELCRKEWTSDFYNQMKPDLIEHALKMLNEGERWDDRNFLATAPDFVLLDIFNSIEHSFKSNEVIPESENSYFYSFDTKPLFRILSGLDKDNKQKLYQKLLDDRYIDTYHGQIILYTWERDAASYDQLDIEIANKLTKWTNVWINELLENKSKAQSSNSFKISDLNLDVMLQTFDSLHFKSYWISKIKEIGFENIDSLVTNSISKDKIKSTILNSNSLVAEQRHDDRSLIMAYVDFVSTYPLTNTQKVESNEVLRLIETVHESALSRGPKDNVLFKPALAYLLHNEHKFNQPLKKVVSEYVPGFSTKQGRQLLIDTYIPEYKNYVKDDLFDTLSLVLTITHDTKLEVQEVLPELDILGI